MLKVVPTVNPSINCRAKVFLRGRGMEEKVPQYLSSPLQVFFFDADEIGVFFVLLMIAVVIGKMIIGFAFVTIFCVLYRRIKVNQPNGYLKHMLYFAGLKRLKKYPTCFDSEFQE